MATKIDPAFQAAPVLQDTYNPVEFAQRAHQEKFQLQKAKYEEQQKTTAEGLQKTMVELKGWEDKAGFQQLMERNQKAVDGFMSLSRKGMNLVNPKSTEEVMAYKALTDYHNKTKELADMWQQQKTAYDLIQKELIEDKDGTKYNHEATQKNLEEMMNNHSIEDRRGLLENAIVRKPQVGDAIKYAEELKKTIISQPEKFTEPYMNPETNTWGSKTTEVTTPQLLKKQVKEMENGYKFAKPDIKEAVKQARAQDSENDPVMSDATYFATMALPQFKQQMIDKITSKGGSGLSLFGQSVKVPPVQNNKQGVKMGDKTFTNHYDYNISKSLVGIPVSNLKGAEVLRGGKWEDVGEEGGLASGQLNFYDADTDSFIFTNTSNAMDAGTFKGEAFSVPRTSLGAEWSDLPVKDKDGKTIKIKDINPEVAGRNSVLKNSGIQWK